LLSFRLHGASIALGWRAEREVPMEDLSQNRALGASELEVGVESGGPAARVGAPKIRSAEAEPLDLPELIKKIDHDSRVDFIEVVESVEPVLQAADDLGAADEPARAQLAVPELDARRDVGVELVVDRRRVADDAEVRIRRREDLGVEVHGIGGEGKDPAAPDIAILELEGRPHGPGLRRPVEQALRSPLRLE